MRILHLSRSTRDDIYLLVVGTRQTNDCICLGDVMCCDQIRLLLYIQVRKNEATYFTSWNSLL